ncbi:MAG: hypothetical protein D6753_17755 [Planctomycetota bacterium]|nr:MAG: hypothetical protein D6753_17755 [Planctomycetota bacterium]
MPSALSSVRSRLGTRHGDQGCGGSPGHRTQVWYPLDWQVRVLQLDPRRSEVDGARFARRDHLGPGNAATGVAGAGLDGLRAASSADPTRRIPTSGVNPMSVSDRRLAVLWPVPSAFRIDVVGPDALSVLHNLTTNDVRRLEIGSGCETFLTNVRGQVLVHAITVRLPDRMAIMGLHPEPESLRAHIDRYIIREEAEVRDRSSDTETLVLVGRDAATGLQAMRANAALAAAAKVGNAEPIDGSTEDNAADASAANATDLVHANLPWSIPAVWINASRDVSDRLRAVLQELDVHRLSETEFEGLRVAARWPKPGAEIGDKTLPQELDRDAQAISFTKGCYLGQETVARLDARGQVQKKLALLQLPAGLSAAPSDPVTCDDQVAGVLTSVAAQPDGSSLALAYLKRGFFDGSQPLQVGGVPVTFLPRQSAG